MNGCEWVNQPSCMCSGRVEKYVKSKTIYPEYQLYNIYPVTSYLELYLKLLSGALRVDMNVFQST